MRYRYLTFIITIILLFSNQLATAYWSHGPISDNTRLNHHQDRVWHLPLLFTDEVVYPATSYCPAGFKISLEIINLSSNDIIFESKKPVLNTIIKKNTFKTFDFGKLDIGQYPFGLLIQHKEGESCPHCALPARMACKIIAKNWPGEEYVYRTTLLCRGNKLYPKELWIPAGKISELFVAADKHAKSQNIKVGDHTIVIIPGQTTMTEFMRPKGGSFNVLINGKVKSELHIR